MDKFKSILGASERQLGDLLVKEGLLSEDQLREVVRVKNNTGNGKSLAEMLVDCRLISSNQLDSLLESCRKRPLLGDILVGNKLITDEQLKVALKHQEETGLRLGAALVKLRYINDETLKQALCTQLNVPFINLDKITIDESLIELIQASYARQKQILPISRIDKVLTIAMEDPTDVAVIQELQAMTGLTVNVVSSSQRMMQRAFSRIDNKTSAGKPETKSSDKKETSSLAQTSVKCDEIFTAGIGPVNPGSRYQFVLLQALVSIVLSYQLLFSSNMVLSSEWKNLGAIGLLLTIAGLSVLPAGAYGARWFVGALVAFDTAISTAVIYFSGNATSDNYLIYFLVILIAASANTLKQIITLSVLLCVGYAMVMFSYTGLLLEGHLLRIPVLLIMGTFYGVMVQTVRRERHQKANLETHLRQAQKMESLGLLAAGVAHEINNPIGFMKSNVNALQDYFNTLLTMLREYEGLEEKVRSEGPAPPILDSLVHVAEVRAQVQYDAVLKDLSSVIQETQEGVERVRVIVQNLKEFSRSGEAIQKYDDVNRLLRSTLKIAWNELKYKATVVEDYGTLPEILCFPQELSQVFLNLLINAAHAIENRGEIRLRTFQQERQIVIEVADTGCGMPSENLDRIFEPFFTTKGQDKGTGLGLSISYGIVKKHTGTIEVESKLGVGTLFRITLPIK